METQPLIIERLLKATPDKVWQALTDNDKMKQWYFVLEDFKPEAGFTFSFYGGEDDKKYLHLCKITKVIPGKTLAYTWQYENDPAMSEVTFELLAEGDNTRLKLTHAGIENFRKDDPAFARESFTEGWTYIIGTSLKDFVEK